MRWFLLLFIFVSPQLHAQYFDTISVTNKLRFYRHLVEKNRLSDALIFVNHINQSLHSDTLQLHAAKLMIELRREREAGTLLEKMDTLAGLTECRRRLMQNHVRILNGDFGLVVAPPCPWDQRTAEIWRIQLLTAAVLKNNTEEFRMVFEGGKCSDAMLSLIEYDLYILNMERQRTRKKSPLLAGLISALLPGAGKVYAGKPHEAFHAFVPVAVNGIQAAEGFYYLRLKSPHFYFFGTLTALFYTSNIAGSVRASKRKNTEFENKIRDNAEYEFVRLAKYY